ncbi:hypothetical protein N7486_011218 [Penicillium sp. IBT 16267x]|nr:hypothetical protein N7486_011218 [Penicillium sp. IBT 16267x]
MGWATWSEFNAIHSGRHERLIQYLKRHGKKTLENIFMYAPYMTERLGSISVAIKLFKVYLEDLPTKNVIQRAWALINIFTRQVAENPELAALSLDEAFSLFTTANNETGQMICEYQRIRYFLRKTHTALLCFGQMLALADRFLHIGNLQWHYHASRETLAIIINDPTLISKLHPVKEELCALLRDSQNEFHVRGLEILEAYDSSKHSVSAEQSRQWLKRLIIDKYPQLTPFQLMDIYKALFDAHTALGDVEEASKYAEERFEQCMKIDDMPLQDRSQSRYELAHSRSEILRAYRPQQSSRLDSEEDWSRYAVYEERHRNLALTELTGLEEWIRVDSENDWDDMILDKKMVMVSLLEFLKKYFPEAIETEAPALYSQQLANKITSIKHVRLDIGDMLLLAKQGQGKEGIRLANRTLQQVLNDPMASIGKQSKAYYVAALSYDIAMSLDKTASPSAKEVDESLGLQIQYLRKHRDLCHPEQTAELAAETENLFQRAERATEMYRQSVLMSYDIATLLRMQKAVSRGVVRIFYKCAVSFYIEIKDAPMAWRWAQKGRARAMFDILNQNPASEETLITALENDTHTRHLLAADIGFSSNLQRSTASEQLNVRTSILKGKQGQRPLLAVPVLEKLLDTPISAETFGFQQATSIYDQIKRLMPSHKNNIILVSWVVEASEHICLMAMDCQARNINARARLNLRFNTVRDWIDRNLVFPTDSTAELEEFSPLNQLIPLVQALSFMSQPEDLLVLSPPAELSAIPIHAIRLDIDKPTLIERNPVVYTPSFSVYLECLRRVNAGVGDIPDAPLSGAVFAASYEEPHRREERDLIFQQIETLGNSFGARHIVGSELTAPTFKAVLQSAPWIHYHGHAYYEASEAMNQCYVLGNDEDIATSSLQNLDIEEATPTERIAQSQMPAVRHKLLSTHFSEFSTLSVSDIFIMDLRAKRPFVCSIACDSGMQDITAGDEPLGLVTALFCAGASSVLGTLWPLESRIGRIFTTYMYQALEKQIDEFSRGEARFSGVLDVGRASREAILKLMKVEEKPISWAGFVLHGAGFYGIGQT